MDRPLKWLLSRCASVVVANSAATANQLPQFARVHVIHNGIDLKTLQPTLSVAESRRRLRVPPGAKVVGMLGRLRPWKGQERFLRIASKVLRKSADTYFVIAGGDPFEINDGYTARLRFLVEELGIANRLTFTGQIHKVADVLIAMDLFVHPGEPEPFGLVNLEAMAMAKPIVAFSQGALPEIVEHDVTGVLVPPCDEEACATAIIELLQSPARMKDFGTAGRARVEQVFQVSRTVHAVEKLLQQQVGGRVNQRNHKE
ncbi:MAG: glycosyltransferase family 4 protein [Gemmatimonadetes bacterium]|nr:glycosyltransferase family 4 protein [Gemmatimonadota bacterium]